MGLEFNPDPDAPIVRNGGNGRHALRNRVRGNQDARFEDALTQRFADLRMALKKGYRQPSTDPNRPSGVRRYGNPYSAGSLASRMGIARPTLQAWEQGYSAPRFLMGWVRWAAALELDFSKEMKRVMDIDSGAALDPEGYGGYLDVLCVGHSVQRSGGSVTLTPKQIAFFQRLLKARGKTITTERCMMAIYGSGEDWPMDKILDVMKTKINQQIDAISLRIYRVRSEGFYLGTMHVAPPVPGA